MPQQAFQNASFPQELIPLFFHILHPRTRDTHLWKLLREIISVTSCQKYKGPTAKHRTEYVTTLLEV